MNYSAIYKPRLNQGGVTLVELLIVMALSTLLISALSLLVRAGLQSAAGIQMKASAQEDSRLALQIMAAEISMASYNPSRKTDPSFWVSNTCGASNQTYRGIPEATATSLTVAMVTDNGDWIGDDSNEVIRYAYDAANQRITRETNCAGGAQSFLGDTVASGRSREVVVVNGVLVPVFRYFNGQGVELTSPVTANIPNIRRIEITLAVETDKIDPTTNSTKKMIYSTGVLVRNHVVQ